MTNTRSSCSGCGSVQIDELNPNDVLRFTTGALDIVLVSGRCGRSLTCSASQTCSAFHYPQFNDKNLPFDGNVTF